MGMGQFTIEVAIDAEGEIETEVKGITGPGCEEATKWLEELGEVKEHRHTSDYDKRQSRRSATMARH